MRRKPSRHEDKSKDTSKHNIDDNIEDNIEENSTDGGKGGGKDRRAVCHCAPGHNRTQPDTTAGARGHRCRSMGVTAGSRRGGAGPTSQCTRAKGAGSVKVGNSHMVSRLGSGDWSQGT